MQKYTVPKLLAFAIAITSVFFLSSCLNDTNNSRPTRYQVGLEIQNIGADTSFTAGSDTMTVESVRFIIGAFNFQTAGQTEDLKDSTGVPLTFDSQAPTFRNPAVISNGNFLDNDYQSLNINFPKAPEGSSTTIGSDFYDDGKRYSIIAEGTYNDEEFTYKSERIFNNSFGLNTGDILEDNQVFIFLVRTDVRSWFSDGQGLYDPSVSENAPAINDNIGRSFQFEEQSSVLN